MVKFHTGIAFWRICRPIRYFYASEKTINCQDNIKPKKYLVFYNPFKDSDEVFLEIVKPMLEAANIKITLVGNSYFLIQNSFVKKKFCGMVMLKTMLRVLLKNSMQFYVSGKDSLNSASN